MKGRVINYTGERACVLKNVACMRDLYPWLDNTEYERELTTVFRLERGLAQSSALHMQIPQESEGRRHARHNSYIF